MGQIVKMYFDVYRQQPGRWLLALSLLCAAQFAATQTTNTSFFTFADYAPTIPVSTTKVFTTSIMLIPINASQSMFDESAFMSASTEFYSNSFNGLISVNILSNTTNAVNPTEVTIQVVYELTYNYTIFISQATADGIVSNSIGSLAAVSSGLESTGLLGNLYDISSNLTNFSFSGNKICTSTSCSASYVFCSESPLGLDPTCRSKCFDSFTCENKGVCVHRTQNLSPNCNCVASSSVWYLGGRCEYKVEVWMIILFVLGLVAIICLIVLIACICCRREVKTSHSLSAVEKKKEAVAPVSLPSTGHGLTSRGSHAPVGYEVESDTLPLSTSPPITSAALVTVQESSSESGDSSTAPGYYEDDPIQDNVEPTAATTVQSGPPVSAPADESRDHSSSSSESERESVQSTAMISGVGPRSSVADSEDRSRRYNSLQFPNSQGRNAEVDRRYQTLNPGSPWDKGTQTNTRINIVLPDSILMNKL